MLTLLRKRFIRDYEKVDNEEVRVGHGILAAVLGLIINTLLVLLKVGCAVFLASQNAWLFSMALLADAIDSIGDLGTTIVTLVGFQQAKKPADKEHPFGHERVEFVAGVIVGTVIVISGAEIIFNSIQSLINGAETPSHWIVLIILGVCILLKLLQGFLNLSIAKIIHSPTLKATAIDSFTDTIATTAVLVSGALSVFGQIHNLDGYFGIAVSCFVIYSGVLAIKESSNPLIGQPVSKEEIQEIERIALRHGFILGVHDIRIHSYGPTKRFISLHAEIDGGTSLEEAHHQIDELEHEISAISHAEVTIHADPVSPLSNKEEMARQRLDACLVSIDPRLTVHDLRFENDQAECEIVLPFEMVGKEDEIRFACEKAMVPFTLTIAFEEPLND